MRGMIKMEGQELLAKLLYFNNRTLEDFLDNPDNHMGNLLLLIKLMDACEVYLSKCNKTYILNNMKQVDYDLERIEEIRKMCGEYTEKARLDFVKY
jgi:hypothetical protein